MSLWFSDQQERRVRCLDTLFVLLGAFPLINNWEPSDNNMPGHPAKYNTAAYEKQNVRGAHVTLEIGDTKALWQRQHHHRHHHPRPSQLMCCRATAPPLDGGAAGQRGSVQEGKGRATKCWGEVMAQHIQALAALWRQINSWPLSYCCSSSNQHQWSRGRGDGFTECWERRDLARAGIYLANLNLVSRKCRYDTHTHTKVQQSERYQRGWHIWGAAEV